MQRQHQGRYTEHRHHTLALCWRQAVEQRDHIGDALRRLLAEAARQQLVALDHVDGRAEHLCQHQPGGQHQHQPTEQRLRQPARPRPHQVAFSTVVDST